MRFAFWILLLTLPAAAQDARQALLDADTAFDRITAQKGLEGWMSFFAEDAQLNLAGRVLKGKAALREYYTKMFARPGFSLRWKPLFAEASRDATLGYTFGTAVFEFSGENGEKTTGDARYVTVWRRQPDGTWKVVFDMGG